VSGCFVIKTRQPLAVFNTPPTTRKRKLDNTTTNPLSTPASPARESEPVRKASKTIHRKSVEQVDAALPATPQTLSSDKPMDSDDEINSVMSSDDVADGDSSVGDFGAGAFLFSFVTWRGAVAD
jgi:hypothetical protein